ncbi:KamA family radical SAM protein [Thermonema rossianum]|uniref:KamA family radical SAM protein n=1 Tax=Thermonema rossianum TaxID=55505 RepID=UPI000571C112|nr:lysine 2,3-aminomutase [Thermonema rossianum]
MKYKAYTLRNFESIPQIQQYLSEEERHAIRVVGEVLPFKVNNFVVDELINWDNFEKDPMFLLTFPQKEMLSEEDFEAVSNALLRGAPKQEIQEIVRQIRFKLNPHPAGQLNKNTPEWNGVKLTGIQHKYRETVLFFPSHGQTCHAYCTFCFRWPQFIGDKELKFAMQEVELLIDYLRAHPEVTDVLFTGGDPMVMNIKRLEHYIGALLDAKLPNLRSIRIGSKALTYWPYRFLTDVDADAVLALFERVVNSGVELAFMAHFNHYVEVAHPDVQKALKRIIATGAQVRTQAPVMRGINDDPAIWRDMWKEQVKIGCIPYYMFVARDTGAQDYFAVTLADALDIYRKAFQQVSGLARTVRGPSMSATPGKVQILDILELEGEKVFALRFLQSRVPEWSGKLFFAKYNPNAIWLDDLEPAFGKERFFYEEEAPLSIETV